MANVILIKRGQAANINNVELAEGEIALAFSADKSKAELYAGNGSGKLLLNPEANTAHLLTDAQSYTDTKISELINGAPEAMDTLKEVADAISSNSDVMTALNEAVGKKVDKEEGKSLVSSAEKSTWNAKLSSTSTIDGGTF